MIGKLFDKATLVRATVLVGFVIGKVVDPR